MLVPERARLERRHVASPAGVSRARGAGAGADTGRIPVDGTRKDGRPRSPRRPGPSGAGQATPPRDHPDGVSAGQLLALQGAAGNRAVAASLQRAPATAPKAAAPSGSTRDNYVDFLNGFQELATAAVNQGGRGLDTASFGPDLSPGHRRFLERVRRVLILAQESSPDSRRAAADQWPALAARLLKDMEYAKDIGIPADQVAAIADNVALVGEKYVRVPRRGPGQTENPDDYTDLMMGIQGLLGVVEKQNVDKRDAVVPLNLADTNKAQRGELGAVQFGGHLTGRHRQLLERLRESLVLARTEEPGSSSRSLELWKSIQGDLRHAFKRAPTFVDGDVAPIQQRLARVGVQLIYGGRYSEQHNEALRDTNLQAPDLVFQVERFKEAARGVEEATKLAQKGIELTGESAVDKVLSEGEFKGGMGHTILELVKYPNEVAEKLEEFKKQDLIGKGVTLLDLADKTQGFGRAIAEVSCEVVKRYADRAMEVAVRAGEAEAAKRWWKISDWAAERLELLEKIGKVAVVISLVISAVKVVDYIRKGEWGKALEEVAEQAVGWAAAAAGGVTGAAVVGGIAVVLAAEVEAVHGAAAMIRYCEKANIREAAMSFVGVCTDAANIEAKDLVADARLLPNVTDANEKALIEQKLASYIPYWLRHIEALSNQVQNTRANAIGGQPELRDALGSQALRILNDPASWVGGWETMAEQIRVVFAGATAMSKYAVEHYPRTDKPEKAAGEGE